MLSMIELNINQLYLDPNNPRLNHDLNIKERVQDNEVVDKQYDLQKMFRKTESGGDEEVTNIQALYESMTTIGCVPIDRIVVRKLKDVEGKYLVLEGNRRVATIKMILEEFEDNLPPYDQYARRKKLEPLLDSFNVINCMLLKADGLTDSELESKISVILGLRHHGSLLEWEPLPRAYNIYNTYMKVDPALEAIKFELKREKDVSSRLSIKQPKVTEALNTYMAYLMLKEHYGVQDKYYSLIQEGVNTKNLQGPYVKIDKQTYQLDGESLEKLNGVCQFGYRDQMPENKKRILDKPQDFRKLGKLFNMRKKATDQATIDQSTNIIEMATDEDELSVKLDDAIDLLNDFINKTRWVETLDSELDRQEKQLNVDDYSGVGNERGNKDSLKNTIAPLKKMLGV